MNTNHVKILRNHLDREDKTILQWAMENGLPYRSTVMYLGGFNKGRHGVARRVRMAVEREAMRLEGVV
ncbi:MAG: DNA-binding protein [Azoarcus sp.]|jgi:hypothetical protein|nr:DNA-binding protein [Azoarcus sp.]